MIPLTLAKTRNYNDDSSGGHGVTYPRLLLPGDAAGQLVGGHRGQAAAHAVADLQHVHRADGRQLPSDLPHPVLSQRIISKADDYY